MPGTESWHASAKCRPDSFRIQSSFGRHSPGWPQTRQVTPFELTACICSPIPLTYQRSGCYGTTAVEGGLQFLALAERIELLLAPLDVLGPGVQIGRAQV